MVDGHKQVINRGLSECMLHNFVQFMMEGTEVGDVPLLVLVPDEELVELLTLELQLVLPILLDGLLIRDSIVLLNKNG